MLVALYLDYWTPLCELKRPQFLFRIDRPNSVLPPDTERIELESFTPRSKTISPVILVQSDTFIRTEDCIQQSTVGEITRY